MLWSGIIWRTRFFYEKTNAVRIFLVLFFFLCINDLKAQSSDFILLKKKGRTIRTFYAGVSISFGTSSGNYTGQISSITKDSIYFIQYDVRQVPTNLGIFVLDTIATYRLKFNYQDISYVGRKAPGFNWSATGGSLFGGGILLTTFGLGTWLFTKPGTQYFASPALVIGSAAMGGIGFLLLRSKNNYLIGSKYHLDYIGVGIRKNILRNP